MDTELMFFFLHAYYDVCLSHLGLTQWSFDLLNVYQSKEIIMWCRGMFSLKIIMIICTLMAHMQMMFKIRLTIGLHCIDSKICSSVLIRLLIVCTFYNSIKCTVCHLDT